MKELPADLSILNNLQSLNINDNPFEEFEAVVAALQTLPSLKALSLNLQQNEEVELILTSLPNLELLNEQGLINAYLLEIDHEDSEEELEQKGNTSPREQQCKKSKAEEASERNESPNYESAFQQYKEANNKFMRQEGENDVKEDKKESQYEYQEECSEQKAENYEVDAVQGSEIQSQEEAIISKVEKVDRSDEQSESSVMKEEVNFEDLEEAVRIYDDFRNIAKRTNSSQDKALEEEFEQRMSKLANALKKDLEENVISELKSARILKVRSEIIDITFQKMIAIVPDKAISDIWNSIRREHNIIVRGLVRLFENSQSGEEIVKAKQEVMELKKSLEEERKNQQTEKEKIKRQFAAERKELIEQISSLEKENQKYLNNIIKRSKIAAISNNNTINNSSIQTNSNKNLKKSLVISREHW
jgi:hypothetical protein